METSRASSAPGSARYASPARTFGVPKKQAFLVVETAAKVRDGEDALARHAGRVRYPDEDIRIRIRNPILTHSRNSRRNKNRIGFYSCSLPGAFEILAQVGSQGKSPAGMKARASIGISIVIAFFTALTIASSPRLHERLHKVDSQHECAATMIASGKCEHSAPPSVAPKTNNPPVSPAFLPKRFQFVVASVPSSIQEHAPPASH